MFEKMIMELRQRATPPATFLAVFAVVFLLVVITVTLVTFILPESYASTVRIKVEGDVSDISDLGERPMMRSYDPYLLQTKFEVIQSQAVLPTVIENLNLNEKWAKRYNAEGKLKTDETLLLLKRQIEVRQFRNTSLIEIRVFSEDPKEAAIIANEIAEVYQKHRLANIQKLVEKRIETFKKSSDYEAAERGDKTRKLQEEADKVVASASKTMPMVTIVDKAHPGMRPVKPNKPLNLVLGLLVGIFLASLAGGAVALIVFIRRHAFRKNPVSV